MIKLLKYVVADVLDADYVVSEDEETLHHIAQFPYIAWPVPLLKQRYGFL